MKKLLRIGVSAFMMLFLFSVVSVVASAAEVNWPTNNQANVKNDGSIGTHSIHGNFQNNTNACAACHSTHTSVVRSGLIKGIEGKVPSEANMCESCHDGTMGFYDVNKPSEGAGVFGSKHESASEHNVSGTVTLGAAPGISADNQAVLNCSSCHEVHGGKAGSDRLLKSSETVALDLKLDPAYKAFNDSTGPNGYKITISSGPKAGTDAQKYANMCADCHEGYKNGKSGYTDKKGDFYYSHTAATSSAGRNCASCHYAHGTDVTLMTDTVGRTVADLKRPVSQGGEAFTEKQAIAYMKDVHEKGSALKKQTNMASCWSCHISSRALNTKQPDARYTIPSTDRYGNPVNTFPGVPKK